MRELSGKRVAVLVDNYYQELEVWYPLLRMREACAEVFTVGPEAGATYQRKLGYPVKADRAIADVGGWAPDHMRRNPRFARLIADADQAAKPIGAICHGAWMLCSAGILKNRRATAFFSIKDDVVNAGADYVDEEVVVDRNLITSRIPDDLPAFCRAMISAIESASVSSENSLRDHRALR